MFYRKRGRVPAPAHVTGGHTVGKFGHGGILPEGSTYDGQLRPWLKTRGKGTSRAAHETPQFPTAPRRSPRAEMSGDGDAAGIYRRWVPEGGIEYIPSKRTFHAQQGEHTRPAPHTRDESLRYFDSQPKKVVNIDANPLAAQGKSSRDIHDVLSPGGVSAAGELNRPTISPRRHPSMGAIPSMAPSSPNHALARKTGTDQCPIVPVSADMPTTAAPPPTLAQRRRLRKLVAIHGSSVFNHLRENGDSGWRGPQHDRRGSVARKLAAGDDIVGIGAFAKGFTEKVGPGRDYSGAAKQDRDLFGNGEGTGDFVNQQRKGMAPERDYAAAAQQDRALFDTTQGVADFANGGTERGESMARDYADGARLDRVLFGGTGSDMGTFATGNSKRAAPTSGRDYSRAVNGDHGMFGSAAGGIAALATGHGARSPERAARSKQHFTPRTPYPTSGGLGAFANGGGTTGLDSSRRASGQHNTQMRLRGDGTVVMSRAQDIASGFLAPGLRITPNGVDVVSRAEYEEQRKAMAKSIRKKFAAKSHSYVSWRRAWSSFQWRVLTAVQSVVETPGIQWAATKHRNALHQARLPRGWQASASHCPAADAMWEVARHRGQCRESMCRQASCRRVEGSRFA